MVLASLTICELRICSDMFLQPSIQTWFTSATLLPHPRAHTWQKWEGMSDSVFLNSIVYMPNKLLLRITECKNPVGRLSGKCIDDPSPQGTLYFGVDIFLTSQLLCPVTTALKSVSLALRPTAHLGCSGRLRWAVTFEG